MLADAAGNPDDRGSVKDRQSVPARHSDDPAFPQLAEAPANRFRRSGEIARNVDLRQGKDQIAFGRYRQAIDDGAQERADPHQHAVAANDNASAEDRVLFGADRRQQTALLAATADQRLAPALARMADVANFGHCFGREAIGFGDWQADLIAGKEERHHLAFAISGNAHAPGNAAPQGGEGWLDRQDLRPDFVFVMLGINNSFDAEANPVEAISQGVEAVIDHIRQSKPGARIVIQSLLPTDDPIKNRDLVQPVNAVLRAYTLRTGSAHYLDLYPAFVDANGLQRRGLFNDGLHPSRDGYRVWRDQLVTYLEVR